MSIIINYVKYLLQIDTPIYNMAAGLCLGIPGEHEFQNDVKEKTQIVMNVCTETTAAKWDFVKI